MLASLSELFDVLLIIAGLVLVITGLVMFIRSKASTDASSVEAFGIKLNVTHPSLILVLAGIGLMLAPRLLPELPGKADKPEPAIVANVTEPVEPSSPELSPPAPSVSAPPTPATPSPAPSTPAPSAPRPATTVQPAATLAPAPKPAPVPVKKPHAAPSTIQPPPASISRPTPEVSPTPAPVAAIPPTPAVSKPARPILAFAALGVPTNRDFWSGETRAGYTRRLHASLQQAGRVVLRMDAQGLDFGQAAFNAWWNESGQHPRSRELCASANAPRALLAARVETPFVLTSIESAFWPELKLRLFVCASQRVYRQQKTLSPQNNDAWPFATEFNSEIERFMRTYRGDLTE